MIIIIIIIIIITFTTDWALNIKNQESPEQLEFAS